MTLPKTRYNPLNSIRYNADTIKNNLASVMLLSLLICGIYYLFLDSIVGSIMNVGFTSSVHLTNTYIGLVLGCYAIAIILNNIKDDFGSDITDVQKYLIKDEGFKGFAILQLFIAVVAPVIEELLFRVLPYLGIMLITYIFGSIFELTLFTTFLTYIIATTSTLVWVYAHGERGIAIAPYGVFYCILLINGMLLTAFVVHVATNSIIVTLSAIRLKISQTMEDKPVIDDYDGEIAPSDAPALPEPEYPWYIKVMYIIGLNDLAKSIQNS